MQLELLDLQDKLQKTVIFITHDVTEAFKIGDRVAVMKDGLNVAIKEMKSDGLSSVYVVDKDRELKGIVTIDDALAGIKEGKDLKSVIKKGYEIASSEDYIQDLIDKATSSNYPIAILDGQKWVGIVPRATVLSSLASQ